MPEQNEQRAAGAVDCPSIARAVTAPRHWSCGLEASRLGIDRVERVFCVEDHDAAYELWKAHRFRDRTVVHFDGHLDFEWIVDFSADRLLKNVPVWNLEAASQRVTIANFLYPVITEGIARQVIWVVPDPFWTVPNRCELVRGLRLKLSRRAHEATALTVSENAIDFRVLDCPFTVCPLGALTMPAESVLLDIDVDYFVTVSPTAAPAYFNTDPPDPWLQPSELVKRIRERELRSDFVTIAYSVNGGFTPLQYKFFGDILRSVLQNPSQDVSDAVPKGSAAEAFHAFTKALDSGSADRTRGAWETLVCRDGSYRTLYAIPGWRDETRGVWSDALKTYEVMTHVDPEWHIPHAGRGRALWNFGRYDEAERSFASACACSTGPTSATYWLGLCYWRRGEWVQARHLWRMSVSEDVTDLSSCRSLAQLERRIARHAQASRPAAIDRMHGGISMTGDPLDTLFEQEPSFVTRRVADEVILVPTRFSGGDAALFTLDAVAAFLWEHLDGTRSGRDLVAAVKADYDTGHEEAERDVRAFLEQLMSVNAIRPVMEQTKP